MTRKDLNWVFEECVKKLQSGAPLESVLAEYPEWKKDLRPVLETVLAIWESRGSDTVPIAAMNRSRERLQEDAQRRRAVAPREGTWQRWLRSLRMATVPAVVLLVAVGLGLTGLASVQALPGQALYPVKLAAEQFSLSLPASASEKLARQETYDSRRNEEVETLIHQAREQEVFFTGYLTYGEDQVWRVDQILLDVPDDLVESLQDKLGRYVSVHADLLPDGRMVLEWVEDRVYSINGQIQAIDGMRIRIDGIWVTLSEDAAAQSFIRVGAEVTVSVVRISDSNLLAVALKVGNGQSQEYNFMPTEKPGEEEENVSHSTSSDSEQKSDDQHDGSVVTPESAEVSSTPEPQEETPTYDKGEEDSDHKSESTPEPTKKEDAHEEKSTESGKTPSPTENHDD